jgi:hypothetical protein
MDRSNKSVRQLEQVFQPCRMMFNELNKNSINCHYNVSANKIIKNTFFKAINYSRIVTLSGGGGSWNLIPAKSEGLM